jgi:hypothetical protein
MLILYQAYTNSMLSLYQVYAKTINQLVKVIHRIGMQFRTSAISTLKISG